MAELKLMVFNVERGLCVYARTPNNFAVMIDCGRSKAFSPAAWIVSEEAPSLMRWKGHALARLIVTHPHDDHVEDIGTVMSKLPPAILRRHKTYDWQAVLNPPDHDPSENAKAYYRWQQRYRVAAEEVPDLGLELDTFSLTPKEAAAIDPNPQHLLNNSSYVTVFTYQPPGAPRPWKAVVAGDNETGGWEALLERESFRKAIRGAQFFVTSHHGHESGFCERLFRVMGRPLLNISSVHVGDTSLFDYSPYARGAKVYGEQRSHLTTRHDGHIVVRMTDRFTYRIWTSKHE